MAYLEVDVETQGNLGQEQHQNHNEKLQNNNIFIYYYILPDVYITQKKEKINREQIFSIHKTYGMGQFFFLNILI